MAPPLKGLLASKGYFVFLRGEGKGRGPTFLKQGRRIYYREEDVLTWIKERKIFTENPMLKK